MGAGDTQGKDLLFRFVADVTGVDGGYLLESLSPAPVQLLAGRGTADSGNAITSADALAALRLSVGINPNPDPDGPSGPLSALRVSPYQIMAAHVNGDGAVKSNDALAILRMAVKSSLAPPQEWLFAEETRNFWCEATGAFSLSRTSASWGRTISGSPVSETELNLVATLKGDVNGTWGAPAGSVDLDAIDPHYFVALAAMVGAPTQQWAV